MGAFDIAEEFAPRPKEGGKPEVLRLMTPCKAQDAPSTEGAVQISTYLYRTQCGALVSTALTGKPLRRGVQIRYQICLPGAEVLGSDTSPVLIYLAVDA